VGLGYRAVAGTYAEFVGDAVTSVAGLPEAARRAVLGETAAEVYF